MAGGVFLFFPGQGAQVVGMARDVYSVGGHAVALFEEASEILGVDLARLVFEGGSEDLARTENCQPALLVACLALLDTWRERRAVKIAGAAGLSLGEYTALVALESMDFADAVRLVRRRGELMEEAVRGLSTGMASVIGCEALAVERVCSEVTETGAGRAYPANYNSPGQIVISGDRPGLERAGELLKAAGARRVLPLKVSGAFHSPFMAPAREGLAALLDKTPLRKPKGRFINNADARELSDIGAIRESLARQLVSPVRWEATCRALWVAGERNYCEVGPGAACAGLMRRTVEEASVRSVANLADIEAFPK